MHSKDYITIRIEGEKVLGKLHVRKNMPNFCWLTNDHYGITGCGVFKAGVQNWKGFCIKINCSQMKLLNFENWTNGEPQ
jgi:hypothetical protein